MTDKDYQDKLRLLARLSAAEEACKLVEMTADIYTNIKVLKAVKVWRTVKGDEP